MTPAKTSAGIGRRATSAFEGYAEGSFGAAEEIDPIHVGGETIAGGVLGGGGDGELRNFEVDGLTSAELADGAVKKGYAEDTDVAAGAAETEAARAAGVGSDNSADGCGDLGGIGCEELFGAGGGVAEFQQGNGWADPGVAGRDFNLAEFFEGEHQPPCGTREPVSPVPAPAIVMGV